MKFTRSITAKLSDATLEAVRANFEQRITELQDEVLALQSAKRGRWLNTQILTGTGTYTPTPGACRARLREIGGGGGGGGASSGAGTVGAGAGGSSGAMLDIWVGADGVPLVGGAYSGGTPGAAGTNAPSDGGNGGDSTITINGKQYIAKGGTGGLRMVGVAANGDVLPRAPAAGTSSGGIVGYGLGSAGQVDDGTAWFSGAGGGTVLGGGGAPVGGLSAGNPGQGLGGGGSGGAASAATNVAGGAGAAGGFVIEEFS